MSDTPRRPSPRAHFARILVVDGSILAGGVLLSTGAAMVYAPAGFLVSGALLLLLGVAGARQ